MTGTPGAGDRPVAVGVDGSRASRVAADWAAREAARRGLPLLLVHAWTDEPLNPPTATDREAAQRLLDDARTEVAARYPSLPVSVRLLPAVPVAGLAEVSREAAVTVLGSRGHGALLGFLLGSVGLPVVAHAEGPVVLVRPHGDVRGGPEPGSAARPEEGDEVVVGLGSLGAAADPLLSFAFTAARARGAAVRAVRAWGSPSLFGPEVPRELETAEHRSAEAEEGRALAATLDPWRARFPQVPVIEHLRFGNASEVLLAAAAFRAVLLVTGRHRNRPRLGTRVGPVVHAALHHARPPVAVVPYG
ncbi:universal stress protein [Streptomyces sp. 7-21]|uniref:universal stress protein n=1 Tax=Streptomyces sp. 7-21 TaxID=2802283 RepID=UPI00191E856A|nr:universal stress protein [Streptomyces sp. 7-21]MBL1067712.1 universal stress protein [Streptomyces sp. 7-21]